MATYNISRLTRGELPEFRDFCEKQWPGRHPLIHNSTMFDYYYRTQDDQFRFLTARTPDTGELAGVLGYIQANENPHPDIWASYLLGAGKSAGVALPLLDALQTITQAETIASNNIRKKTASIYEFMGWTIADMRQFYRLNSDKNEYTLCIPGASVIPSVYKDDLVLKQLSCVEQLEDNVFDEKSLRPRKSRFYVINRYFLNPWIPYRIFAVCEGSLQLALLVIREFPNGGSLALRVSDYIGPLEIIPRLGFAMDALLRGSGADFLDWWCYGIETPLLNQAGFVERTPQDGAVVPLYLAPVSMENITITMYTSHPEGYVMNRADGDQDRPHLEQDGVVTTVPLSAPAHPDSPQ